MALEQPILLRIVTVLLPFMNDADDREAQIRLALWQCPVLAGIRWTGAARPFTINLISQLDIYGEWRGTSAVVRLLQHWRGEVGDNVQREIDAIIADMQPPRADLTSQLPVRTRELESRAAVPTKPSIESPPDAPSGAAAAPPPRLRDLLAQADDLTRAGDHAAVVALLTPYAAHSAYSETARDAINDMIQHARDSAARADAQRRAQNELDEIIFLAGRDATRRRGIARWRALKQAQPTLPVPAELGEALLLSVLPAPFAWCSVTAGTVTLEDASSSNGTKGGIVPVPAFRIAKYPTTNAQYQAFIDAGGYADARWWGYSAEAQAFWEQNGKKPKPTAFDGDDTPRTNVSWFESVAFCLWLAAETGLNISLPSESQWQRAAQGDDGREYPWGNAFDPKRCNVDASGFARTTPVTKYDHPLAHPESGCSPFGVADLSGNVWEWCLDA
ncbi:MAG: SUMF1/EgtB/PvdO family nonheme iron enzyme [Chloroflexota bacterium]|nr:SUMF1/EgtB/PvdO family nonheme iron enzyme [Chloroflexota bacterium]